MSNIGEVLQSEIARLSKRALRKELNSIKAASGVARKEVMALKKQIQQLEREVARLRRSVAAASPAHAAFDVVQKIRFSVRSLKSQRKRLGLSATDFGRLFNVGAQTIYNWESAKSEPRTAQKETLASVRAMGKREALAKLQSE
jgi:DNA-binding transcriptional regulator YiaG